MNIYDIKPTEPLWEVIEDNQEPKEIWFADDLKDSIRKEGFKYALNVSADGNIRNGNARYWCARQLLEEEEDQRFLYLPVEKGYAAGIYMKQFQIEMDKLPKEERTTETMNKIIDEVTLEIFKHYMNIKSEVIPSETEFKDYEIDPDDPIFLKRHWEQSVGEYVSFVEKHPKQDKYMFFLLFERTKSYEEALKNPDTAEMMQKFKEQHKEKAKHFNKKSAMLIRERSLAQ
jgi:hypothetical protein